MLLDYERFVTKPVERKPAPAPVVRRELVDLRARSDLARAAEKRRQKEEKDQLTAAVLHTLQKNKRHRIRKRQRISAFAQTVAEMFPATRGGKRSEWPILAERYLNNRFMPIMWYGKQCKMHHASVLYALREMGIYEERGTPEFRAKQKKMLATRAKAAEWERNNPRAAKAAKKVARAELEARLQQRGEFIPNPNAKLTFDDVKQIKARIAAGEKPDAIALDYAISSQNIRCIRRDRTWRHVPWPVRS